MFCASHAGNTFFVAHRIRNVLTQVFQSLILTGVLKFLGGLDNARRFWKQAKLLDPLINNGLVSKIPCMIYSCRKGLQSMRFRLISLSLDKVLQLSW